MTSSLATWWPHRKGMGVNTTPTQRPPWVPGCYPCQVKSRMKGYDQNDKEWIDLNALCEQTLAAETLYGMLIKDLVTCSASQVQAQFKIISEGVDAFPLKICLATCRKKSNDALLAMKERAGCSNSLTVRVHPPAHSKTFARRVTSIPEL